MRSLSLLLLASAGCAGEPPPAPVPPIVSPPIVAEPTAPLEPSLAETPLPSAEPVVTARPALAKLPPEVMKQYRFDVCYYGGLALRQARDDYLHQLGKSRPGPGRLPSFVDAGAPGGNLPHERNARACVAAAVLHDPDFGDADAALAAYAPLAMDAARNLSEAHTYYRSKEHTSDGLARGQALHDRLVPAFAQLDAFHDRLGAALTARRKAQPPAAMEAGERLARAAVDDARDLLTVAVARKVDVRALAAATEKLGKSAEALAARNAADPLDAWPRILVAPMEAFRKTAATPLRAGAPRLESEVAHALIQGFIGLLEGRQRATSRAAMASARPARP